LLLLLLLLFYLLFCLFVCMHQQATEGIALFLLQSAINHSCAPVRHNTPSHTCMCAPFVRAVRIAYSALIMTFVA
jgi:hypothetical protein